MLATVQSFGVFGLDAQPVTVEVDIARGLPGLTIVGLPDKAIEEAKERVRSAISNTKATFPVRRITINLAPADLKKVGPAYDLPIALGILRSDEQLSKVPEQSAIIGELALDGSVRPVTGVLAIALAAAEAGTTTLFVPRQNASEAAAVKGVTVFPVDSLGALMRHLLGEAPLEPAVHLPALPAPNPDAVDLRDIRGQQQAKRALEIAAAGGHNVLLSGPPGSGKTLLAKAFAGLLPPLSEMEQLEVTRIHSVAGMLSPGSGLVTARPIRTPHHTASAVALIGGGTWPKPGEISLAHRGVLFLDELPEFPRSVLEVLRQPLEDGVITVSRAASSVSFPAKFILIAAQNPCPCGRLGTDDCTCLPTQVDRYQRKISGPLLDRIDLYVEVPAVKYQALTGTSKDVESSEVVRARVEAARARQRERLGETILLNAAMTPRQIEAHCLLDDGSRQLLARAVSHFRLSARAYHKTLKIARTIADLAGAEAIEEAHIAESLQYRARRPDTA